MPFTLAINVINASFYTRIVLEKDEKVAVLESKKKMLWLSGIKNCIE